MVTNLRVIPAYFERDLSDIPGSGVSFLHTTPHTFYEPSRDQILEETPAFFRDSLLQLCRKIIRRMQQHILWCEVHPGWQTGS